jgi:FkbM family methyltransferase
MQLFYKISSFLKKFLLIQFFLDHILIFINLKTKFAIPHEYSYFGLKFFEFRNDIKIIDIGANIGVSTVFFLNVFKKSQIVAFEPNLKLKNNLQKIKFQFRNFKFYNTALGRKKESLFFYKPIYKNLENHYLSSFDIKNIKMKIIEDFGKKNLKKFKFLQKKISINKLDNFKLKADFIKIDVEGFESKVIEGALKTIRDCTPVILIEINSEIIFFEIRKLLRKFNYKYFVYSCNGLERLNKKNLKRVGKMQINIFCVAPKYLFVKKIRSFKYKAN